MSLKIRDGSVTMEMDDGLSKWVEKALRAANGAIYDSIEDEVRQVWQSAVARAPVKSGRFKRGLAYGMELDVAASEIKGTITSEAPYTRWVRAPVVAGYTSVWQGLVAAPMRRAGKRLVTRLAPEISDAIER